MCFAIALRNGLEHSGDCCRPLDSTPTYMRFLYSRRSSRSSSAADGDRHFEVVVEYAKASPEDILIGITVAVRGGGATFLHVAPTLWFPDEEPARRGDDSRLLFHHGAGWPWVIAAVHPSLGEWLLYADAPTAFVFTGGEPHGASRSGARVSAYYPLALHPGGSRTLRLRLCDPTRASRCAAGGFCQGPFGREFDEVMRDRRREAWEFRAT
jgi:hypothetical protein